MDVDEYLIVDRLPAREINTQRFQNAIAVLKRRLDIGSGGAFIPWDQMGYIIIGILLALPFLFPMETVFWFYFGFLSIFNIFMHFLVSFIAYKLGVKKTWY